ncbi:zinc finger protein 883-like [Chrysoperla carnea]|uniref:zinc finger protein 883-like n=1 Tax=Chrysoperla carnea TaxID=189513 RepID=UPI001D0788B6|nr:zinc finger protein 883-like [Chrysoperla carnea]
MTLERFCRLCAVRYPLSSLNTLENLRNEQLDKLILKYLQIKIDEGFPNIACEQCCKTISNFHKLLTGIKAAQEKLNDIYSEYKNLDIKLEDEEVREILSKNIEGTNFNSDSKPNNVKTEIDYHNDSDNLDSFLNFIDETNDSDSSVTQPFDEELDAKVEKLNPDKSNDENLNKSSVKKNIRKIHWLCYKCDERLRNADSLEEHFQEVHKSKVEYVCIECQALFKDLKEFKDHYYGHDVVKNSKTYRFNYTCETCGKQFYDPTNYKGHCDMHLGIKRFECEICGRNFAKKQHKEIHKLTVCSKLSKVKDESNNEDENSDNEEKSKWKFHDINHEFICSVCDELFENNEKYDEHLKRVHDIEDGIQTGSTYESHTLTHTGVKRFTCKNCGRKFHLKQHLVAHSLTHLETVNSSEVKCNQCDKICKNEYLLKRHLNTHRSEDEKYVHKCDICKRKFMYAKSLAEHQKQGHDNEEVICDQCGKVFKDKYRLSQHLSSHIDGLKFTCDQCPKEFKSLTALKAHKKTHAEKSYECEVCGKKFSLRGQLTVHSTIHTGQLPYECSYCKKQFRRKYYLTVHLRQHTGERPYSCTECNHYFASDSNFIKHLKGRHGLKNFSVVNKRRYPFDD